MNFHNRYFLDCKNVSNKIMKLVKKKMRIIYSTLIEHRLNSVFVFFYFSYTDFAFFSGPFGEQDDEQVFVQKVIPETPELYVRLASNGKR